MNFFKKKCGQCGYNIFSSAVLPKCFVDFSIHEIIRDIHLTHIQSTIMRALFQLCHLYNDLKSYLETTFVQTTRLYLRISLHPKQMLLYV